MKEMQTKAKLISLSHHHRHHLEKERNGNKQASKQTFSEHLQTKDMEMKQAKLLKLPRSPSWEKCIVTILIVFVKYYPGWNSSKWNFLQHHLCYLEYQNPKHFFALGILELWKSLSFHVRFFIIFQKVERLRVRIFLSSFEKVVFSGVDGLINWLIEEMKEGFRFRVWYNLSARGFQVKEVRVSQSNIPSDSNGFIEMKGLGFWSNLSLRGVSEFEDWVSNPTPGIKGV